MTLSLGAIPLAFFAGMLSILSPCVWPLVPIVMGSAAGVGRMGPLALAAGLSLAFAFAGSLLSFVLVNLGLDPELFRFAAAAMLVLVAVPLLVAPVGLWLNNTLSRLVSGVNMGNAPAATWHAQFGVGMLLGIVWLPCVGPTLGAAIALASLGQQMLTAFLVMLAFGAGTAAMLLVAGLLSSSVLLAWKPRLLQGAGHGKRWFGGAMLVLGIMVLSGVDKWLEAWAIGWLPDWAVSL